MIGTDVLSNLWTSPSGRRTPVSVSYLNQVTWYSTGPIGDRGALSRVGEPQLSVRSTLGLTTGLTAVSHVRITSSRRRSSVPVM